MVEDQVEATVAVRPPGPAVESQRVGDSVVAPMGREPGPQLGGQLFNAIHGHHPEAESREKDGVVPATAPGNQGTPLTPRRIEGPAVPARLKLGVGGAQIPRRVLLCVAPGPVEGRARVLGRGRGG